MAIRKLVATNLKSIRVKAGLTQAQLSERTKINIRHISQMENGALNLTLDTLERLANGLEVTVEELVKGTQAVRRQGAQREKAGIDVAIALLKRYRAHIDD